MNPAQPTFEIGTWYFDKRKLCYVQVVAGAQRDGYVTVYAPRDGYVTVYAPRQNAAVPTPAWALNPDRKHRFAQPPLPVRTP